MSWRTFSAAVVLSWAAAGCQPGVTLGQAAAPAQVQAAAPPVDSSQARAQKPEISLPPAAAGGETPKQDTTPAKAEETTSPDKGAAPKTPPAKSLLDVAPMRDDQGAPGDVDAKIRATVNGVPILESELRDAVLPLLFRLQQDPNLTTSERDKLRGQIYNDALQELINREMLLSDAYQHFSKMPKTIDKLKDSASKEFERVMRQKKLDNGIRSDEDLKRVLRAQGTTLEAMRRSYERNFLAKQYLAFLIGASLEGIGHKEIQEYYKDHPEEFQGEDRVEWQDIFLLTEKYGSPGATHTAAAQMRDRVRAGEKKFEDFIQYDDGESHLNHGQGTGHRRGEIRPQEAEEQLFRMKDGDVGELIEISSGIHIIHLVHREFAGLKPCDEKLQAQIKDKLRNELGNREMQRILQDLKRKATIEISHIQ